MAEALSIPTIARPPIGIGGGPSISALATGRFGPGEQPLRFANTLARVEKTPKEKATEAAKEFVAIALVQPTLKALRDSNHAAPPFAPGDAERRFGALLDAEWAKRITESSNFPLVNAVRDRMMGVASAAQPASPGRRPAFEPWPEGVPIPSKQTSGSEPRTTEDAHER